MSQYQFSEKGFDHFGYWMEQDKKKLKKIYRLLHSIARHGPMEGEGKPERLKYSQGYSRRIDQENRLVYDVQDDVIIIKSCRGHYED